MDTGIFLLSLPLFSNLNMNSWIPITIVELHFNLITPIGRKENTEHWDKEARMQSNNPRPQGLVQISLLYLWFHILQEFKFIILVIVLIFFITTFKQTKTCVNIFSAWLFPVLVSTANVLQNIWFSVIYQDRPGRSNWLFIAYLLTNYIFDRSNWI